MSATAPIAGPGVAEPGHNRSGYQDTRDEFVELVRNQLAGLDVWEKRETLDDDLAPRANDFVKGLKKLKKEGDDSRKAEKLPHTEAAKAVDTWWAVQIDKLDKALGLITTKIDAFLKAKEVERQKAEALAKEKREQAERDAEAARLAAAHASSASQRIEAEARAEQAATAAADAAKQEKASAEPARVASATGLANNQGLRKQWKCDVKDLRLAVLHLLKTNPDDFEELVTRLAGAALRAAPIVDGEKQVPTISGVEFSFEKVFK